MEKKKGMGKFVAGAMIGAGLGVLFAPKKGSETRKELKMKLDELVANLKNIDVEEVKADIEDKILDIKDSLADLDKEKVLEMAKKKAEELVDLAVEKGTPVLKKTAEDVKTKTIEVLEETIKKLEGTDNKSKKTKTK